MNRTGIFRSLVTGAVLSAGLAGCATAYHDGPPFYTSAYYQYPYRYHYYPGTHVYYHIYSGDYFYRDGDHWKRSRDLPRGYRLDRRDRVRIWSDADKPYARERVHREKYKPERQRPHENKRDPEERRYNRELHEHHGNRQERRR